MRAFPLRLAAVCGVLLTLACGGAQTPASAPIEDAVPAYPAPVQRRTEYLALHLSLNAAQKAQVGALLNAAWNDLNQAYAFPGATTDSKRVKQVRVKARQRISLILTPEQRGAYAGMRNQDGLP